MKYENIKQGVFINRLNRFIANVIISGKEETVHVKNTGKCKELLTDNATVFCQEFSNTNRKTKFDLISVYKNDLLINMDSQAPNKVFYEFLKQGNLFNNIKFIKPEYKYNNSRIDFYAETANDKILIEVKGVTLENNGVVLFPDAPTQRGLKHINELTDAIKDGYKAYVVFVVQMEKALYFTPNYETHSEFGHALETAKKQGVNILAYTCNVTENSLSIKQEIKVKLN